MKRLVNLLDQVPNALWSVIMVMAYFALAMVVAWIAKIAIPIP